LQVFRDRIRGVLGLPRRISSPKSKSPGNRLSIATGNNKNSPLPRRASIDSSPLFYLHMGSTESPDNYSSGEGAESFSKNRSFRKLYHGINDTGELPSPTNSSRMLMGTLKF
jgi:hypothetical protein